MESLIVSSEEMAKTFLSISKTVHLFPDLRYILSDLKALSYF